VDLYIPLTSQGFFVKISAVFSYLKILVLSDRFGELNQLLYVYKEVDVNSLNV